MTKNQMEENKKMIYAMDMLENENTWLRLKNAKDFTEKMKQEDSSCYKLIYD